MDNLEKLAKKIGFNLRESNISKEQIIKGMIDEKKEHGKNAQFPVVIDNNPKTFLKIALAHLVKDKTYYK